MAVEFPGYDSSSAVAHAVVPNASRGSLTRRFSSCPSFATILDLTMRKRKWLRWIFVLAISLFAASIGLSRALRNSAARRFLIAHLEASFGRPVEVGRFDFNLLDGARLEAHSVTISEDPRFGHEYFLRADTLRASLRWPALLSGRFEFGSLSLSRPSLNLVRNSQGRWNIEQWLPPASPDQSRAGFVGPSAAPRSISTARLYRIAVDGGRINFKQGDDKSPVALVGVSGRVDQDSPGRWALESSFSKLARCACAEILRELPRACSPPN